MKNIIIISFMLLCYPIQQVFSQVKVGALLELGYENKSVRLFDDAINETVQSLFLKDKGIADVGFNLNYKGFLIYAKCKTYFNLDPLKDFRVSQFEYKLGACFQLKCFLFNVEHMRSDGIKSKAIHEAYDKISVALSEELFQQSCSEIEIGLSLELGYENRRLRLFDEITDVTGKTDWLKNSLFADGCIKVTYRKFSVYTGAKSYFKPEKFYNYDPLQIEYMLGVKYQIKSVSLRLEHLCSHSIQQEVFYEAYDRFSVVINFGNKKQIF